MTQVTNNLWLVEFLDHTIEVQPPDGYKQWIKPKYGLSLQSSGWEFYPVIKFYKNKGIESIFMERTCTSSWEIRMIRDLGSTTLTHQQIFDMMKESLRVQSIGEFYSMIHTTMDTWVKCITGKDVTIPRVPYNEYFGIEIINKEDSRLVQVFQEEIEANIRQEFNLRNFSFHGDPPCSIL